MHLIVGLGNPGVKYTNNRHNIGFMALDAMADWHRITPWKDRFQGQFAEGRVENARVLLLKPATFMNLSGQSVGEAMRFYKLTSADVTVFHDELDLSPGKLRAKTGGGHAGHNGLRSIHQHIGDSYNRVRMGIGHPGQKDLVARYVLQDFSKADQNWLGPMLDAVARHSEQLINGAADRFQNDVARDLQPPKPAAKAKPVAKETDTSGPEVQDPRSPLQKLLDKFN